MPREASLFATTELLAALWKAIRDFEPDYLFCPPLPRDPLAGVHVDHVTLADAVRKVAYLINVPHAFTPEYPADETQSNFCKTPVVLNVYDPYTAGVNSHDLAIDIKTVFPRVCEMSWCHQSQIMEWLPWVGRHDMKAPASLEDWSEILSYRLRKRNREMGLNLIIPMSFLQSPVGAPFQFLRTWWQIFQQCNESGSRLEQLRDKLRTLGTR